MKKHFCLLPFLFCLLSLAFSLPATLPLPSNVDSIQARDLKRHLSFLASPELGGRYTLSSGNRIAARYLASQLEFFGFRGAMPDGNFFQTVPFRAREVDNSQTKITLGNDPTPFTYGEDFIANLDAPQKSDVTGELVFVGYGISSPGNGYDDYAGLDLKGKIAIFFMPRLKPKALEGKELRDVESGFEAAMAHGCVAAISLPNISAELWTRIKSAYGKGGRPTVASSVLQDNSKAEPPGPVFLTAGPSFAARLLDPLKTPYETIKDRYSAGQELKPQSLHLLCHIQIAAEDHTLNQAQNVVGILEGRDPELKKQYVVLSAHYDHLEATAKEIYPGADDDGSGTSGVLEIAHVLAQGERPRRSVLVLFNTGEEIGLVGSNYFTEHPPVPLEQIVADFNLDMIGRTRTPDDTNPEDAKLSDKDSVYLIGPDKHSTELFEISEQTNKDVTKMRLDYTYNNESDPSRLFYRSDHWNFAKRGIPVIFYFNGLHVDYHKPTDTVDKIDFEKMARVARLVYATSWRVANLDHRLKIDKWKQSQ